MTTTLDRALTEARTDWLAGDPKAWARYLVCVRGTMACDRTACPHAARAAASMTRCRPTSRAKA
ncbi:MAG: hypothetical protein AAF845_17090 [Bacteroidota bacterium]